VVAGKRPKRSFWKRAGLWSVSYLLVAALYLAFFSYPVPPTRLEGLNYTSKESVYQTLPYIYEIDYIAPVERSVVVVLTIRTISLPDKAYSAALRNAEGITEKYLREQYGLNVDVRFSGESPSSVNGHAAVRQDYDVYDTMTGPFGRTQTLIVAKMSVIAWFCNDNLVSVAAGFFHGPIADPKITENLRCH
jgi:hypothetical protein